MGFVQQDRCNFARSLEGLIYIGMKRCFAPCGLLLKYRLCFRSYELAPSVEAVKASCNLHGRQVPNTVIAGGFSGRAVTQEEAARKVQCVTRDVLSVCHTHMFQLSLTQIFQTRECAVGNPSARTRLLMY